MTQRGNKHHKNQHFQTLILFDKAEVQTNIKTEFKNTPILVQMVFKINSFNNKTTLLTECDVINTFILLTYIYIYIALKLK